MRCPAGSGEETDVSSRRRRSFSCCILYQNLWALVQVEGDGAVRPGKRLLAGEALMAGLQRVTELDRWKKDDGASFVFFEPHPTSADEKSGAEYRQFMCSTTKHSMHIVAERGQRNICQVIHLDLKPLSASSVGSDSIPGSLVQSGGGACHALRI